MVAIEAHAPTRAAVTEARHRAQEMIERADAIVTYRYRHRYDDDRGPSVRIIPHGEEPYFYGPRYRYPRRHYGNDGHDYRPRQREPRQPTYEKSFGPSRSAAAPPPSASSRSAPASGGAPRAASGRGF